MVNTALYVGVPPGLVQYDIDPETQTLERKSEFDIPLIVQYAWQDTRRGVLYVGASDRDATNPTHQAWALKIADDGSLSQLGDVITLPYRPVHVSLDPTGSHFLISYNRPSELAAYEINEDGSIGTQVDEVSSLDAGNYSHQVRVTPDGKFLVSVARGNPAEFGWWAQKETQKDPGSVVLFEYDNGRIGARQSYTIGDGHWFGPRHLDFHPTLPYVYVSLETQNEILVYERDEKGFSKKPIQRIGSLADPDNTYLHHGLGTVHVHPDGKTVYFANRSHKPVPQSDGTSTIVEGKQDNSIVAYRIDQETGELTLIQRAPAGGLCPRTFALDGTGTVLISANAKSNWVKGADDVVSRVTSNLVTFKVHPDGRLEQKHTYPIPLNPGRNITWAGTATY